MLTKKFTDFSADLLDTVRGVLGEAKKCKDCGCAKCECEDEEDDMEDAKEGYIPTADEPTEANKKTADKVRALLAKEKKMKKESIDPDLEDELKKTRQTKKSVEDAKKKYGVKEEAEQIDEISGKTLASYSSKVANYGPMKDAKTREKHEKGLYTAYKKMKGKDVKVPARMEEVEQIDELSKATMGRYVKKAAERMSTQGVTAGLKIAANEKSKKNFDNIKKREKGIDRAVSKLTKEEQDFIDSLNNDMFDEISINELSDEKLKAYSKKALEQSKTLTGDQKLKRQVGARNAIDRLGNNTLAKEEVEIAEARGRPRKAGAKDFTIHPKTKEKLMHNNPEHMKKIEALQRTGALQKPKTEAGQHIINQLRKASTSMTGGTTVHFTHGDSKHVSAAHASKALDKYAGMKPNEKEDFQKKIGHSHENLMKHI